MLFRAVILLTDRAVIRRWLTLAQLAARKDRLPFGLGVMIALLVRPALRKT